MAGLETLLEKLGNVFTSDSGKSKSLKPALLASNSAVNTVKTDGADELKTKLDQEIVFGLKDTKHPIHGQHPVV